MEIKLITDFCKENFENKVNGFIRGRKDIKDIKYLINDNHGIQYNAMIIIEDVSSSIQNLC